MSEIFGRYMLFNWDYYENAAPFDCIHKTSDDYQEVKKEYDKIIAGESDGAPFTAKNALIFDRVEGIIINSTEEEDT